MEIVKIDSVSKLHKVLGLSAPKHPLISIFQWSDVQHYDASKNYSEVRFVSELYSISQKDSPCENLMYGRNVYDFNEGSLMFVSPGQVLTGTVEDEIDGWGLIFHPELIRHTTLDKKMKEFTFFRYDVHEALFLSEKEKNTIKRILEDIQDEYSSNTDVYTKDLIVSQLELLLNYCQRFYSRQFITRTSRNKDLISQFEAILIEWLDSNEFEDKGLPTVKMCAKKMGMSPDYLSDMLKQETGKNAQDYIHFMIIDRAKNLLLSSSNTVSEVAYKLGFEYPQYFSKLFKLKTGLTPSQYRNIS